MSDQLAALRQMSETLTSLHFQGRLPAAEYKKGLVALAHDLIVLGEREEAISLIGHLDDTYVDSVLPVQMEMDLDFRPVAVALGKYLRGSADPVDVDLEQALMTQSKVQGKPC